MPRRSFAPTTVVVVAIALLSNLLSVTSNRVRRPPARVTSFVGLEGIGPIRLTTSQRSFTAPRRAVASAVASWRPPLTHIPAGNGRIALTFDDGPDPRWTGQVLALLRAYHLHATFCLIGEYVARYPALVRAIVAGGNTLCDHTWSHDEHLGKRPPAQIKAQLQLTYDAIVTASGGARPRYFRAPGGNWTPALIAETRAQGMMPLGWTVDPRDWSRPGAPAIVTGVLRGVRPGGIVLMHDGYGHREETVAALRQLLPALAARRLHSVAL